MFKSVVSESFKQYAVSLIKEHILLLKSPKELTMIVGSGNFRKNE